MAYKKQLQTALDRLDQGLARVHSLVKRGQNTQTIHFMENDLNWLYKSNFPFLIGSSGLI